MADVVFASLSLVWGDGPLCAVRVRGLEASDVPSSSGGEEARQYLADLSYLVLAQQRV